MPQELILSPKFDEKAKIPSKVLVGASRAYYRHSTRQVRNMRNQHLQYRTTISCQIQKFRGALLETQFIAKLSRIVVL